jgi:ankyrin repeat protein
MTKHFMKLLKFVVLFIVTAGFSQAQTATGSAAEEAFFRAVANDDAGTVSTMFLRGVDPNSVDPKGQLAVNIALREGNARVLARFLAHPDLKVNLANAAGETPLMMAALKGELDWMRKLLDRGAEVVREGWSPLHYAASGPGTEAVQLLIERGAALDARSPNGTTPLMMAAKYGAIDAARLLLARGADPKLRNELGLDAAEFARQAGRERLAEQLAVGR